MSDKAPRCNIVLLKLSGRKPWRSQNDALWGIDSGVDESIRCLRAIALGRIGCASGYRGRWWQLVIVALRYQKQGNWSGRHERQMGDAATVMNGLAMHATPWSAVAYPGRYPF